MCEHEDFPCCGCDDGWRDGPVCENCQDEGCEFCEDVEDNEWEPDDSMDGDFDSAMRDAGQGTNEDYGDYGQYDDVDEHPW